MSALASEITTASIAIGPMVTPTQQYRMALIQDEEGLKLSFEAVNGFETRVLSLLASRTVKTSTKKGAFSLEVQCGSCVMVLSFTSAAIQHKWLALLAVPPVSTPSAPTNPYAGKAQYSSNSALMKARTSVELKPLLQPQSAVGIAGFAKRSQSLDTPSVSTSSFQTPCVAISVPDESGCALSSIFDEQDGDAHVWDMGKQHPRDSVESGVVGEQAAVQVPRARLPKRASTDSYKTRTGDDDWDELYAIMAVDAIDEDGPSWMHSSPDDVVTHQPADAGLRRHSDEPRKSGWSGRATVL